MNKPKKPKLGDGGKNNEIFLSPKTVKEYAEVQGELDELINKRFGSIFSEFFVKSGHRIDIKKKGQRLLIAGKGKNLIIKWTGKSGETEIFTFVPDPYAHYAKKGLHDYYLSAPKKSKGKKAWNALVHLNIFSLSLFEFNEDIKDYMIEEMRKKNASKKDKND